MWLCRTIARSPTVSGSRMTYGHEIQRRVEVRCLQAEIGARNRRGEAVVEGLCEAQRLVDSVPAELDRQLVGAQLAGVEEAQQLDPWEVGLAELAELAGAVLVDVPRVIGLLRARGGQGEQVGRRDVGEATGVEHRLEVLEDRA